MTCTKDCELIEEYREEIEAIAECFTETATERANKAGETVDAWADVDRHELQCKDMAEDLNMKFQGSGVARSVFSVVPDPDSPKKDPKATEFAECVFKFARSEDANFNPAGPEQNRREVDTFQGLTDEEKQGTDGKCPLFNPVKDHDKDNMRWILQPWAPPPGNISEVRSQMAAVGINADRFGDLHSDNIGAYPDHGESCVIDYGFKDDVLDKARMSAPDDQGATVRDRLKDMGMLDIEFEAFMRGGGDMHFYTDKDMPGEKRPESKSSVTIDKDGNVTEMDIFFPGFPSQMFTKTEIRTELAMLDLRALSGGVKTREFADIGRDFIGANLLYEVRRSTTIDQQRAMDDLELIVDEYNEQFNQYVSGSGGRVSSSPQPRPSVDLSKVGEAAEMDRVRAQWTAALESAGMRNITFDYQGGNLNDPDVFFDSPTDIEPRPPTSVRSTIYWNTPTSVESVMYRAANIEIEAFRQAEARGVMNDVIDELIAEPKETPVSYSKGLVEVPGLPSTKTTTFTMRYEFKSAGAFMDAEDVVEILNLLTQKHNTILPESLPEGSQ